MRLRGRYSRLALASSALLLLSMVSVTAFAVADDAPAPVEFPRDDGPHDAPIEWWYYTGHLTDESGTRFGFEFVIFKAQVAGRTGLVAHVAVTDPAAGRFTYDQRRAVGQSGAEAGSAAGVDLTVGDWSIRGVGGDDQLRAAIPGYTLDLVLAAAKAPVLHDGDGFIDYGAGQGSYYYSRTRLEVAGTLTLDGVATEVTGEAWFDHQWGNFRTSADGGWDWFALQFDDGSELMLYVVRDEQGRPSIVDGASVAADGSVHLLEAGHFTIEATGSWTSSRTGINYPSGWNFSVPNLHLRVTLNPTLPDQELDATATTGVIYWEGEVTATGTRGGTELNGLGYVELTGYGVPAGGTPPAIATPGA